MPEISVDKDDKGRSEFVFVPLQGEVAKETNKLHIQVSAATSCIKRAMELQGTHSYQKYVDMAINGLSNYLPRDFSEQLVEAMLKGQVGRRFELRFRGKTIEDGFKIIETAGRGVVK